MSTETLEYEEVRTKKQRRCSMCGRRIRKGALAHYWAGIYDGDFQSAYAHGICQYLWETVVYDDTTELIDEGEFWMEVLPLYAARICRKYFCFGPERK